MGWGRGTRTKRSPGNGNWSLWEAEGGHGTGGGPALPERQGMDRMHQQHGKCQPGVGTAPSPHPALGRRRQRHSEHPRRVHSEHTGVKCREEESSTGLCVVCVQTAATSTLGMAMWGHGGGQRPNQVPSTQEWFGMDPRGMEKGVVASKTVPQYGVSLPSLPARCQHPRAPVASWGLPQHPTSALYVTGGKDGVRKGVGTWAWG